MPPDASLERSVVTPPIDSPSRCASRSCRSQAVLQPQLRVVDRSVCDIHGGADGGLCRPDRRALGAFNRLPGRPRRRQLHHPCTEGVDHDNHVAPLCPRRLGRDARRVQHAELHGTSRRRTPTAPRRVPFLHEPACILRSDYRRLQ